MPNVPSHLDLPRVSRLKENIEEWAGVLHKTLQRQWTTATQAYNAILRISTAADRPSTPLLDEALWYESDTGRSFIAQNGAWRIFSGFTGATTTTSVSYTMLFSDGVILANAASGAVVVTVNNGSTYTSRIRAVKKVDSSGNAVTVTPSSGLIDGAATYSLGAQWDAATFTSDGTDLFVIGRRS